MNFHKKECLNRAKAHLAAPTERHLRYACLELRYCIEAICFDKLALYATHLSPEVLNTWQPHRIVDILVEYDPLAAQTHSTRIWREDASGHPEKLVFTGTHVALTPVVLSKHYHKLGNYLHVPTLGQRKRLDPQADAKLLAYLLSLADELEAPASNTFDTNIAIVVTSTCEDCQAPIVRNKAGVEVTRQVICNNPSCLAIYDYDGTDGKEGLRLRQAEFDCAECSTVSFVPVHKLRDPIIVKCVHCGMRHRVEQQWMVCKEGPVDA